MDPITDDLLLRMATPVPPLQATKEIENSKLNSATDVGPVWIGWLQFPLLILVIIALYYRIIGNLVAQWWTESNSSHGFIVPVFSAWLVWKGWKKIAEIPLKPSWWGFLVVLGASGFLLLGTLGAENFLSRTSLLILLAGLVIYFRGWQLFSTVFFPWAILFLMIPLPTIVSNEITLPLQFQASWLASGMLALTGVPVLRDGNLIVLPSHTLEVAEACSGLRSLMSLITLTTFYSYIFEARPWRRVVLILAAIPIAVVANAFRIMGNGLLAQYWDPAKAAGFFHIFSGWLIFLFSLGLLLALHTLMSRVKRRIASEA
jgi:exosortase